MMSRHIPASGRDELEYLFRRDVGQVRVCGLEAGVAELALDDRDGDTLHEEFVGHRVTQAMWVDVFLDASPSSVAHKHLADHRA